MPLEKASSTMRQDEASQAMLFEGASVSQLARLFGMDNRNVKAKLHGCKPVANRSGNPIYSIKEAARYLVEPIWPIDEYIERMKHTDLPMMLRKEFWAGMRSRQIYEQAAGDLWPTDQVQSHIAEILKTISLSLRLSADTVEREVGVTDAQREVIIRLMDEALANAHRSLQERFEKPTAAAEHVDDEEL